jgi:thiamine biosynthesis lipoprotein ApbE
VSLGGDLVAAGSPPIGGWPVTVSEGSSDHPELDVRAQAVRVIRGALATSSTVQRRWHRGGHELHHIIDPSTGLPVESVWRTASVYAPTCVDANAAATAALIAGDEAEEWLESAGVAARLVDHAGDVTLVGGWPERAGSPLPDLKGFVGCMGLLTAGR